MNTTSVLPLQIYLLGEFRVSVGDRVVDNSAWQRRHARQLVKMLAISQRQQMHREAVMEYFWPDASPANATNNLNKILFMARRALEPELVKGSESAYLKRNGELIALQLSNTDDVDILAFEAIAQQAMANRNPELLRRAATLYKGELLPEDRFEENIIARRDALALLARQVLESWALYLDESGDVAECIHIAQRLIELDAANEWSHRLLMRLYHDQSLRSRAIEQYHQCREALIQTVGCHPEEATEQLFDTISKSGSERSTEPFGSMAKATSDFDVSVLAVIPFFNVDHLDSLEYLCEGLTENLISRLSRMSGYDVLSRSLVYRLRAEQTVDPANLRNKYGVDLILLGRLRSLSERLHLWVELVRTSNQSLVWAEFYDVDQAQLQALGDQIAESIADGLDQTLDKSGNCAVTGQETESVAAFHDYLKGRYHWNKRSAVSLPLAKEHFLAAIDKDPLYASAYAGLADCYNLLSLYTDSSPRYSMPKARAAAQQALQFAPLTAELQASLAYYEMSYEWRFQTAERLFKSALELNSDYATAWQWYHKLLVARGRFSEARECIDRAQIIDPLSRMVTTEAAWGLYHAGQFDEAIETADRVINDEPSFSMAHYVKGISAIQISSYEVATKCLATVMSLQERHTISMLACAAIGHAHALAGYADKASDALDLISSSGSSWRFYAEALIFSASDKHADAIASLHRAVDERCDRVIFLPVEPMFSPMRGRAEFQVLVDRLDEAPNTPVEP